MAKNKTKIALPSSFREIDIGKPYGDVNVARREVRMADGKVVLIKDEHMGDAFYLGRINDQGDDAECYNFVRVYNGEEDKIRLHYHDLEKLLVGE